MKKNVKLLLKWIPAIVIICISWYLSSKSNLTHIPSFRFADKIVHFICFGGLSFWIAFGCNTNATKKIWLPVLLVSCYGIIDEIHQSFTPGRSTSFWDWTADFSGSIFGAFVFVFVVLKIVPKIIKK